MKRIYYFTHYLSFFSILLFSTAFSINAELYIIQSLHHFGIYQSFMDVFSETYIKLILWFVLFLLYFMLFSAMKLTSDMLLELSLYFFSKGDRHPAIPRHSGGLYFLIHSILAVFFCSIFCYPRFSLFIGQCYRFFLTSVFITNDFFKNCSVLIIHITISRDRDFFWLYPLAKSL